METRFMLIFCILIIVICEYDRFVIGGRSGSRSRGSSHRSSGHRTTSHSHNSGGGGHFWSSWTNWGGSSSSGNSGGATASARKSQMSPPLSHRNRGPQPTSHASFSNYGKDYEANFHIIHSQRQYTPVPRPYQRHFHPQTTGKSKHFDFKLLK